MKRTFVAIIGLGIIGGLGYLFATGNTDSFFKEAQDDTATTSVKSAEVLPTPAELLEAATLQMVDEAIAASSTEITAAMEEAALEVEEKMRRDIERNVRARIKAENDARIEEIDKQTGAY